MTTYSISLDDVDLALLPIRTAHNDFLRKEHFQFRVMKELAQEPPTPTSDITYTCHICAMELPAAFAREHAASVKHRANARIASAAAQRTRALITALPPPHTAQPTARFCTSCAVVADADHDRTKEHKVAVMHDNLLWELMKAYVGDEDGSENGLNSDNNKIFNGYQDRQPSGRNVDKDIKPVETTRSYSTTIDPAIDNNQSTNQGHITENKETKDGQSIANSKGNNPVTHSTEEINKLGNNNKTENNQLVTSDPSGSQGVSGTSQKDPGTTVSKETVLTENKKTVTKEPYEKELRKFMDTENQFQIKEIFHRIHMKVKDDTVNIYSDHFHSFHRMYNDGNVECIVCSCTLKEKDVEAHKYDLNHMSGVAKIGKDGNYVRKINETHSHCILCNQKINNINVSKHKQSQHHLLRKTNNVKTNAAKTKETVTTENDVKYNEVTINDNEDDPISNDVTSNESVEINKHPYKLISGELRCVVCDCQVPRDLRNRKDHLKGLRHANNLKIK